jgi:broad specificity phosphatase PhoE
MINGHHGDNAKARDEGDVHFITHPDVVIDPKVAVPDWPLSGRGQARMRAFTTTRVARRIASVVSSTERKAIETARFLAELAQVEPLTFEELCENDRSSTGYLPKAEFETTADLFFRFPFESVRGWERAVDAQARIIRGVERVLALSIPSPLAIVAHGGVGTLLLCHLKGDPITRDNEQPGGSGGNCFSFERSSCKLRHGWLPLEAM